MKKLFTGVLLLLVLLFVSTNTTKADPASQSTETELLMPLYNNKLENAMLRYTETNTLITNWEVYGTNDQGSSPIEHRRRLTRIDTKVTNGFRKLVRSDGESQDSFNHFKLGAKNPSNHTKEREDGFILPSNLLARSIHSPNTTKGTNGSSEIAYILFHQPVTNLDPNMKYVAVMEISGDFNTHKPRGTLNLYEGNRYYTVEGDSYTSSWRRFEIAEKNKTQTVVSEFDMSKAFAEDKTRLSVSIRLFTGHSDEPNATHHIKRVSLVPKHEYETQKLVNELYDSNAQTKLAYNSKTDYEAKVQEIKNRLNTTPHHSSVSTYVNKAINAANEMRSKLDVHYDAINNFYTDNTLKVIKESITQTNIDTARTDINAIENTPYKIELLKQLSDAEFQLQKQNAIARVKTKSDEYKELVDAMVYLSESQKETLKAALDKSLSDGTALINAVTKLQDISAAELNASKLVEDKYLEIYKENAKAQIDKKVTDLIGSNTPSAELQAIIDSAKSSVESKTTTQSIDDSMSALLLSVELKVRKEEAIAAVNDHQTNSTTRINALTNLTDAEKKEAIDKISDAMAGIISDINSSNTLNGVATEKETAIQKIENEYIELLRLELEKEIDKKIQAAKTKAASNISDTTELAAVDAELDEIKVKAVEAIKERNSETALRNEMKSIDDHITNYIELVTASDAEGAQEKYKKALEKEVKDHIEKIESLEDLDNTKQQEYITKMNQIGVDGVKAIEGTATGKDARIAYTNAYNALEAELNKAKLDENKALAIAFLEGHENNINQIIEGEKGLTDSDKSLYKSQVTDLFTDAKRDINAATTNTEVTNLKDTTLENMVNILLPVHRTSTKNQIQAKNTELEDQIKNLKSLSEDEKNAAIQNIGILYTNAATTIDSENNKSSIDQTFSDALNNIEQAFTTLKNLNDRRESEKDKLQRKYNEVKEIIQNISNPEEGLTERLMEELEAKVEAAKKRIDEAQEDQLTTISDEELNDLNQMGLTIDATDKSNKILNIFEGYNTSINNQKHLSVSEIQKAQEDLKAIKDGATTKLNAATTKEELEAAYNEILAELKDNHDSAKKISDDRKNAKEELDRYIETIIGESQISDEVKKMYDKVVEEINQSTTPEALEKAISDGTKEILDHVNEEVQKKREELKAILEETAEKPMSEEVKAIIENGLDKVNGSNYHINDLLKPIEDSTKYSIVQQEVKEVQDKLRQELEAGAQKPISEEVKAIIDEQVKKINKDNYKDETAINTIKDETKELITDQEVKEAKDKLRQELEAGAQKPISEEVKAIIDEQVKKINKDNYKDETAINTIKDETKELITDQEVKEAKDKLRQELEKDLKKPISDDVKKIIDDIIDKVTKDNYKDTDAINKITTDGQKDVKQGASKEDKKDALDKLKKKLDEMIANNNYKQDELDKLNEIYEEAKKDINNAETSEEVEQKLNDSIKKLDNTKPKTNNTLTWVFVGLSILLVAEIIFIILKKRKARA